jgi:hypothetical protein
MDWGPFAPLFVFVFEQAHEGKITGRRAWALCILCSAFLFIAEDLSELPVWQAVLSTLFGMAVQTVGGFLVLKLYNGKRAQRHTKFFQWFFYLFYPLHLLILALIRIFFFG